MATFTEHYNYPKYYFVFFPVLILDSLSQLLNIVYTHYLDYDVKIIANEMYFELLPKIPFSIHLGICYILIGISVLMLIKKVIDSPRLYRIQYSTVKHRDESYAILMTNFYQFKLFNEVFGQEAGDRLLKASAEKPREKVIPPIILLFMIRGCGMCCCVKRSFPRLFRQQSQMGI